MKILYENSYEKFYENFYKSSIKMLLWRSPMKIFALKVRSERFSPNALPKAALKNLPSAKGFEVFKEAFASSCVCVMKSSMLKG